MSTSKLPEWPEKAGYMDDSHPRYFAGAAQEVAYHEAVAEAALARMEALVEYVMHRTDCNAGDKWPCTCGLTELLAACERRSGG